VRREILAVEIDRAAAAKAVASNRRGNVKPRRQTVAFVGKRSARGSEQNDA
jgi:hypothetical protein